MSLEESQCAAFLANTKPPLGAFLTAGKLVHRGGPKDTLAKIILASLFIVSLKAAIPAFVSRFPTHQGGLLAATNCGYESATIDEWEYWIKAQRYSDAVLSFTDRNISAPRKKRRTRTLASLPHPTQSYTLRCPAGAICHPDFPFTFSSVYNLMSQHFGFNIDILISLQISETCYRPTNANFSIAGSDPMRYGLYYGPVNVDGFLTDYTTFVFLEQDYSPGYTLILRAARTDIISGTNDWTPNSTLILGGDTMILFYFIGWIQSSSPIDDPVFGTFDTPDDEGYYRAMHTVAPIVCDTKYQFCADKNQHDCSPLGPSSHIVNWLQSTKRGGIWEDMAWVQSDPGNSTIARELGRLSRAGMAALASTPQLASLGFWNIGGGSDSVPGHGLCNNVVIESTNAVSVLLTPYYLFFCFSSVVIIISYANVLGLTKLRRWREYRSAWTLYSVGQLHRQVAEQQCGQLYKAEPSTQWPDLSSGPANGFEVTEKNGSMYLASRTCPITCSDAVTVDIHFRHPSYTDLYGVRHTTFQPRHRPGAFAYHNIFPHTVRLIAAVGANAPLWDTVFWAWNPANGTDAHLARLSHELLYICLSQWTYTHDCGT
jgi:hypothetical protein